MIQAVDSAPRAVAGPRSRDAGEADGFAAALSAEAGSPPPAREARGGSATLAGPAQDVRSGDQPQSVDADPGEPKSDDRGEAAARVEPEPEDDAEADRPKHPDADDAGTGEAPEAAGAGLRVAQRPQGVAAGDGDDADEPGAQREAAKRAPLRRAVAAVRALEADDEAGPDRGKGERAPERVKVEREPVRARGEKHDERTEQAAPAAKDSGVFKVVADHDGGAAGPVKVVAHAAAMREGGAAALARGADPGEGQPVVAQSVRGLSAVLQQGGGTLVMRLSPATLGNLTLHMELHGTQVAVQVEAGSVRAHELLSEHMGVLRSALESKGLTVERMHVGLSAEASRSEAPQQAGEHQRAGRQDDGEPEHDAEDGESRGPRDQDGARDGEGGGHEPDEERQAFGARVRMALDTHG